MSSQIFADIHSLAPSGTVEAQVCIIGTGPGGAFVAMDLVSQGYDVLMLDAGSKQADTDFSKIVGDVDVGAATDTAIGFSRQFGGSSNLWAGRVLPLNEDDLARKAWIPESGWPISWQELAPLYEDVKSFHGIDPALDYWAPPGRQDIPSAFDPVANDNGVEVNRFVWARTPLNTGDMLQKVASSSIGGRLRVALSCQVTGLEMDSVGTAVEQATVKSQGRQFSVRSKCFVLAAGGLEIPRILLNSTARHSAGIGNQHGLVGRYLSTHPKADIALLMLDKRIRSGGNFFADTNTAFGAERLGLRLAPETQESLGTLNHFFTFSPRLEHQFSRLFESVKKRTTMNAKLLDRSAMGFGLLTGAGRFLFNSIGRLGKLQPSFRILMVRAYLDQFPSAAHRLSRSSETDEFGMPKLKMTWSYSSDDRASVVASLDYLDKQLRSAGKGKILVDPLRTEAEWPLTGVHSHFMGTTRMAQSEKHGVTDSNGMVFGTSNLYISGPSLFPTYGFANPFMTICALGLRMGRHIGAGLSTA